MTRFIRSKNVAEKVKKKLRIAVWHNLPSGGGKRALYDHVKGLVARGHHVESWCPPTADQTFLSLSPFVKEHIVPLEMNTSFYSLLRPSFVVNNLLRSMDDHCRRCAVEMRSGGFDILFANACIFLRTSAIAKYSNIPSVLYLGEPYRFLYEAMPELPWIQSTMFKFGFSRHGIRNFLAQNFLLNGLRMQARGELEYAKQFDKILVNSLYSRECILKVYNLESKVCYLGVDAEYYRPSGESKENYIVGLGTILLQKGIDRAIKAVATIDKQIRPSLIWIGNGASKNDLPAFMQLAKDLDVQFICKINVAHAEVISLLSRARAMIYTSRLEPFGLAPLEANACGTPVVAIAEGGVRETISNGVNGFIVPEDDPEKLGALLTRFIIDPELSYSMGKQAREHVMEHWNMTMCIDNLENNLYEVIEKVKK